MVGRWSSRTRAMRSATLAAAAALGLALVACGGGGDGGDDGRMLPPLSTDTYPPGARVDVSALDLFPAHAGDRWVYARTSNGVRTGTVTRTVVSGPDPAGDFSLTEDDASTSATFRYRLDANGLLEFDPLGAEGFLPALFAALPSYVAYPTPLYPAGGTITRIRQGSLQTDIDGDGRSESYRIELTQTFVGFESMAVFGRAMQVARFSTTLRLNVLESASGWTTTVSGTEETYLASGLGLVRADRTTVDEDGLPVEPPYRLDLDSATIGGFNHPALAGTTEIALDHQGLVYDATRDVYYASVTSTDPANGNRIATIVGSTGAVTYSRAIGSSPGPLAVAADGASLYAGLGGSGEVVRLALPDMSELSRTRLPVDPFFGQTVAEVVAASPVAGDTVAVSLALTGGISPRHAGVALVRAAVLQPNRTQTHTGSNRICFDAGGGWLYGYNNETSEFGLRRIEVLADGLAERSVVPTGGGFGADLDVADGLAIVSNQAFRADASLALQGTVGEARHCVKLPGTAKVACHSLVDANRVVVADSVTFAQIASPAYTLTGMFSQSWRLVPGKSGEVAVSEPERVTLFRSDSLR